MFQVHCQKISRLKCLHLVCWNLHLHFRSSDIAHIWIFFVLYCFRFQKGVLSFQILHTYTETMSSVNSAACLLARNHFYQSKYSAIFNFVWPETWLPDWQPLSISRFKLSIVTISESKFQLFQLQQPQGSEFLSIKIIHLQCIKHRLATQCRLIFS